MESWTPWFILKPLFVAALGCWYLWGGFVQLAFGELPPSWFCFLVCCCHSKLSCSLCSIQNWKGREVGSPAELLLFFYGVEALSLSSMLSLQNEGLQNFFLQELIKSTFLTNIIISLIQHFPVENYCIRNLNQIR